MNKKTKKILITGSLSALLGSTVIASAVGLSQNENYIINAKLVQQNTSVQPRTYDVAPPTFDTLPKIFKDNNPKGSPLGSASNYLNNGGVFNASDAFKKPIFADDFIEKISSSDVTESTNY